MVICAFIALQAFPHTSPVLPPLPKRLALDKNGWTGALLNPGLLQYQQALANAQFQQASAAFYPTGEPPPNTFWGHRDADDFRLAQNSFTIHMNATSCFKRETPLAARSLLSLELGRKGSCIISFWFLRWHASQQMEGDSSGKSRGRTLNSYTHFNTFSYIAIHIRWW